MKKLTAIHLTPLTSSPFLPHIPVAVAHDAATHASGGRGAGTRRNGCPHTPAADMAGSREPVALDVRNRGALSHTTAGSRLTRTRGLDSYEASNARILRRLWKLTGTGGYLTDDEPA